MTDARTPASEASPPRAGRGALIVVLALVAVLGIAARLAIAWHSIGTNDARTFYEFAQGVEQLGLMWMYGNVPLFNHPPIISYWSMAVWKLTGGGEMHEFSFVFKLPVIAGDVLGMWLLWRIGLRRRGPVLGAMLAAAFAWSPIAILVGAYHCNTDNLLAVLCLLAVYLMDSADLRAARGQPVSGWLYLLGGLALGAAVNVKLIAILLIVPLLMSCRGTRATGLFIAGLALATLPFLPPLLMEPEGFYRNVITYRSQADHWGLVFLMRQAELERSLNPWAAPASLLYNAIAPAIIILVIVGLSLANRARPLLGRAQVCAISLGIFLVLAPGFGVQYLVVLVPLLFAVDLRFAVLYSAVGGLFLLMTYWLYWNGRWPWFSEFEGPLPIASSLVGLVAWVLLADWTLRGVSRGLGRPRGARARAAAGATGSWEGPAGA